MNASLYRDRDVNELCIINFFSLAKLIRSVLKEVAKREECKYDFINLDNEFGHDD